MEYYCLDLLRYSERCFCDGLTIYLLTYLFIYLFAQSPSLVIFFLHLLSCYLDLCIVKLYVPDKCFILENLHIFYLLIIFLIQKYIFYVACVASSCQYQYPDIFCKIVSLVVPLSQKSSKKLSLETVRPTAKISEKSAADFPPDKVFR